MVCEDQREGWIPAPQDRVRLCREVGSLPIWDWVEDTWQQVGTRPSGRVGQQGLVIDVLLSPEAERRGSAPVGVGAVVAVLLEGEEQVLLCHPSCLESLPSCPTPVQEDFQSEALLATR